MKQWREPLQRLIAAVDQELTALTRQMDAAAPEDLPVRMGMLTSGAGTGDRRLTAHPEPPPGGQLHRDVSA